MYCPRCGEENKDTSVYCNCCGCELYAYQRRSKAGRGVLLCILLSVIGLIIGLTDYPAGSYERNTFCKGWLITYISIFISALILEVVLYLIYNVF